MPPDGKKPGLRPSDRSPFQKRDIAVWLISRKMFLINKLALAMRCGCQKFTGSEHRIA
ncbi:Hypothetical protein GbCGDNIH2_7058 [Granulibacter bethesdensis]|uniref:Uncharacterized protein n=1 Tax=Granulibacter bethesdensis (strain ATCC BAA-1260 / CGDNIH1) TaxID=391165 RepID=A0A286M390_GRABC|nr:Hypothetical protein GbCGDNIH2_7058 [Granulibacter bethesdensis]APH52955.1 Hypothetical protein GbCGDNIH5_7058 [Granulibacter bethesdensis]APH65643.1 Hypothetical protein GbCGDNIH1I4_7058 [Granulibacter bethesdensis]ASV62489.1 Hypothetical protein GbCGDNIH1_7058 [Granulibacter bethesdensis CGDNIH1]